MLVPVLLTFIAVFLVISSIFFAFSTVKDSPTFALKMRLRRLASDKSALFLPEDIRNDILKEIPPFEKLLNKIQIFRTLDRKLDHAGLKIQPYSFILYSATLSVVPSIAIYLFFHKTLLAVLVFVAIILSTAIALHLLIVRREEQLTEQLPDVLMMISRSLRAGHALTSAVELVGLETPNPIGELFKTAYEQQKLGLRITDTLANMIDRIESLDLRFFITTVTINSELGGNLSEILDKLAETIRQRLQIRRQIRVYTAQGRLSGYVLAALPVVMFITFTVMNPQYERLLLEEKIGNYMLMAAVVMQILGYMVIKKIINIRI